MIVLNGGPGIEISEAVLFPYDDRTIPFRYRLQIGLVEGVNPYKGHLVAMERGGPGTPDSRVVKYYGAVCQVEDELRLWYLGHGDIDGEPTPAQVCYAVSTDGVNWEKPELGLVEFNGSKRNNLLPFQAPGTPASCSVLYDPEDPDPARRFKMVTEDNPYYITVSYSDDGIHWKEGPNNPILKHNAIEPTGLIRFNGCYLLNGQGGNVGTKRALVTFVSWDFDNWSDAVVLGLRRDRHPYRQIAGCHAGEQVHLGAGLWDRGNVLIGVYGMWHGESNDRRFISMDLGFLVSNDALHFTEPIPDFKFIAGYEIEKEGSDFPTLEQGQGFANVGDESLVWYSNWRGGDLHVARFPRDRLGYFEVVPDPRPNLLPSEDTHQLYWREHIGDMVPEYAEPHCISCPIDLKGSPASVYVNVQGLSPQNRLTVELLDERMRPLPGFGRADCLPVADGLRTPVAWKEARILEGIDSPVRVRINWECERPGDVFLYAAYVANDG